MLGARTAAAGEERQEPIRLTYVAAAGCPDEAYFEARVQARTPRARFAQDDEDARRFDVALEADPRWSGVVTVRGAEGVIGRRHVRAPTCEEAADALALIVALAVDPRAALSVDPPAIPGPPAAQSSTPVAPPPATAPLAGTPPEPSPPASAAEEVGADAGATDAARALPAGPRPHAAAVGGFFAGADFVASQGVAPDVLFAASPYAGWRGAPGDAFEASVRAAFVRAGTGALDVPPGTATFTLTAGRLDACASVPAKGALRAAACARLEAGELEVAGGAIDLSQTARRFWLAAGPVLRPEWAFVEPFFVEAEGALLLRATIDHFFFLPQTNVYQVPLIGLSGGVGIGVRVR